MVKGATIKGDIMLPLKVAPMRKENKCEGH